MQSTTAFVAALGSPLGSKQYIENWLNDKIKSLKMDVNLLVDFPNKHAVWNMLYYCFRSKVNHLQRTVSPHLMFDFLTSFEDMKESIFANTISGNLERIEWYQACLPITDGGFGLGFSTVSLYAAYIASCATSFVFVKQACPISVQHDLAESNRAGIDRCSSWVGDFVLNIELYKTLCGDPSKTDNVNFYSLINGDYSTDKIQAKLMLAVDGRLNKDYKRINADRGKIHKARYLSTRGKHSGAWLRALSKDATVMTSEEFAIAARFRLGMKLPNISNTLRCDCKTAPLVGECGEHFHACAAGKEINNTHKSLVKLMQLVSSYAGIQTIYEPSQCFPNTITNARPDTKLIQPNLCVNCIHHVITDCTVTHPGTQTNLKLHSDTKKGISAVVRENAKNRKYCDLATANEMHFVPLVFESWGRWGKQLIDFVDSNVQKAWQTRGRSIPFAVLKQYWIKRIAVTLQVMNARMFLKRTLRVSSGDLQYDDAQYDNILNSNVRVSYGVC